MSRQIWSREKIIDEIAKLYRSGFDITQTRMESIDSKLTSAAIRYFGSWKAAVQAAGIDYEDVAAVGRQRRSQKITKWTKETILDEIRRLNRAGEDLTSTVVRQKYLSLYATARRKDHFGSWASALDAAGIDYSSLKQAARARRKEDHDWKSQLLEDYHNTSTPRRLTNRVFVEAKETTALAGWARELVRERLTELYEQEDSPEEEKIRRLQTLIQKRRKSTVAM